IPLPQGPAGRAVDTGVRVVAVDLRKLPYQVFAILGRQATWVVLAEGQDQRSPYRCRLIEQVSSIRVVDAWVDRGTTRCSDVSLRSIIRLLEAIRQGIVPGTEAG